MVLCERSGTGAMVKKPMLREMVCRKQMFCTKKIDAEGDVAVMCKHVGREGYSNKHGGARGGSGTSHFSF